MSIPQALYAQKNLDLKHVEQGTIKSMFVQSPSIGGYSMVDLRWNGSSVRTRHPDLGHFGARGKPGPVEGEAADGVGGG